MAPHRIATLTLNPAIDLSAGTAKIVPAEKLRCHAVRRDPGGGGINVARVVQRLGGAVTAIFPSGGLTGTRLEQMLARDGVHAVAVPVAGETREDFSISEEASGQQFRFVLPGAALRAQELEACLAALDAAPGEFAVVSGSLPEGAAPSVLAEIAARMRARGRKLMVDTSGAALAEAVQDGVFLIKPNAAELASLSETALSDEASIIAAAQSLVARGGTEYVALTLGANGARLIGREGIWSARPPQVTALSTVGAGDSFLGGFVWALARDEPLPTALRYAVAAGSAALLAHGTELAHADDVHQLFTEVTVTGP